MNKTAIRNFAVWARNKLINDVTYRAGLMGVTANGIADPLPQSTDNVQFFDIGMSEPYQINGEEIKQRKSLVEIIKRKEKDSDYATAFTSVVEEVAYTWFNRLIAIRFMEVNDYLPSHVRVLSSESGKLEPDLVTTPFEAELFFANGEEQFIQNLKNENKLDEVFRILFIKQCNALYEILPRLFENLSDYTELLLNVSFIDQDGMVYHLVHDISEEDFNVELGGQVEIIGWLYQFYNDEKKNEVININKAVVRKEDIPAATQLFTTDWVVRYIVDNSLGKYWIERNPSSKLGNQLDYYIKPKNGEVDYVKEDIQPHELRFFDPCMGSGHFLIYAFDVLMKIYEECGYSQRDASKSIIENNLFGLDIDDRAAQLAYFAVMMKARQYNRRIFNEKIACNAMGIVESNGFDDSCLIKFDELKNIAKKLLDSFYDAKEYGSTLQLSVTEEEIDALAEKMQIVEETSDYGNFLDVLYIKQLREEFKPIITQAKILSSKYHIVDTNPPYFNKYDEKLKSFLNENYKKYAGDLFSVFIYRNISFAYEYGYVGFMTPFVWMFIKTYEELRRYIINTKCISSLIQMEYSAFEEATVPICSFVIKNIKSDEKGYYIKLSDFVGGMEVQKNKFIEAISDTCDFYYETSSKIYEKLPGLPIAFWATEDSIKAFDDGELLANIALPKQGLKTGDNLRFVRLWHEIDNKHFSIFGGLKWFPYNKGGEYRQWYGNNSNVIFWENDGYDIKNFKDDKGKLRSRPQNLQFMKKQGLTYTDISSTYFGIRWSPSGFLFDATGSMIFAKDKDKEKYLLGILSSKVVNVYTGYFSATIHFEVGEISNIPIVMTNRETMEKIDSIVTDNIGVAKNDWDSFETSWDFKKHPLV